LGLTSGNLEGWENGPFPNGFFGNNPPGPKINSFNKNPKNPKLVRREIIKPPLGRGRNKV